MPDEGIFIATKASPSEVHKEDILVNGVRRTLRRYGNGLIPVLFAGQAGIFDHGGVPTELLKSCTFYSVDLFEKSDESGRESEHKTFKKTTTEAGVNNPFVCELEAVRTLLEMEFGVTGKVTIMTHSAACVLGMLYAQAYPEKVKNLVLIAGSWDFSETARRASKNFYFPDVKKMYEGAFKDKILSKLSSSEVSLFYRHIKFIRELIPRFPDLANCQLERLAKEYLRSWQKEFRPGRKFNAEEEAFWKLSEDERAGSFEKFADQLGIYDTILHSLSGQISERGANLLKLQLARYCLFPARNVSEGRVNRYFHAQSVLQKKKEGQSSVEEMFMAQYEATLPLYCSGDMKIEDVFSGISMDAEKVIHFFTQYVLPFNIETVHLEVPALWVSGLHDAAFPPTLILDHWEDKIALQFRTKRGDLLADYCFISGDHFPHLSDPHEVSVVVNKFLYKRRRTEANVSWGQFPSIHQSRISSSHVSPRPPGACGIEANAEESSFHSSRPPSRNGLS